MEDMKRIFTSPFSDDVESTVDDLLGYGLLSVLHDDVHELGDVSVTIFWVPHDGTLGYFATTRHNLFLPLRVLGTLHTILGATLTTVADALGVQCAADDVITNSRKVLHSPTTNHYRGVLL
jgi:hypothetical protein